jgi:cyclic pyranopterin phosphate synthase
MAEEMVFVPKRQVLTLEELQQVAQAFTELGVRKIRLTGGEPLIRTNVMGLVEDLGQLQGLEELVITTNGSQLQRLAVPLRQCGVKRVNISLDSLNPSFATSPGTATWTRSLQASTRLSARVSIGSRSTR